MQPGQGTGKGRHGLTCNAKVHSNDIEDHKSVAGESQITGLDGNVAYRRWRSGRQQTSGLQTDG
jgi:hypothetical protein